VKRREKMSRHSRRHCCKPRCCKTVSPVGFRFPRISPLLVAGVLAGFALKNLNRGPNLNTNIININSDDLEDIDEHDCDCDCDCDCEPKC
jgi:hypothetical protein